LSVARTASRTCYLSQQALLLLMWHLFALFFSSLHCSCSMIMACFASYSWLSKPHHSLHGMLLDCTLCVPK
jgi:hypothetical protein